MVFERIPRPSCIRKSLTAMTVQSLSTNISTLVSYCCSILYPSSAKKESLQIFCTGLVTEFRFSQKIAWGANDWNQLWNLIDFGWGMCPYEEAFVFVDNHDNQRGHGGGGKYFVKIEKYLLFLIAVWPICCKKLHTIRLRIVPSLTGDVVTHKDPATYNVAVAYMLAQDYGFARVMSSYYFDNTDVGPPMDENGRFVEKWKCVNFFMYIFSRFNRIQIKNVQFFRPLDVIINSDGTCGNGWVCEHRWNVISKMVRKTSSLCN